MKEEIAEGLKKRPLETIVVISFLVGTGAWQTFYTPNAVSKEQMSLADAAILDKAKDYTDNELKPIKDEMRQGFSDIKCEQLKMQVYNMDRDFGEMLEKENENPSSERRRQIRDLKLEIDDLKQKKDNTCHPQTTAP